MNEPFKVFIYGNLEEASTGLDLITQNINQSSTVSTTGASWVVKFTYRSVTMNIKGLYSRNLLTVCRDKGLFTASLTAKATKRAPGKLEPFSGRYSWSGA